METLKDGSKQYTYDGEPVSDEDGFSALTGKDKILQRGSGTMPYKKGQWEQIFRKDK